MSKSPKHKSGAGADTKIASTKSVTEKASDAANGISVVLENNPLVALLGGIALGAAAGALIPRSDREKALLSPLGDKIADAARAALDAGREAGAQALSNSGLTGDGLREQVSGLVSQATAAATQAGAAAFTAAKDKATG